MSRNNSLLRCLLPAIISSLSVLGQSDALKPGNQDEIDSFRKKLSEVHCELDARKFAETCTGPSLEYLRDIAKSCSDFDSCWAANITLGVLRDGSMRKYWVEHIEAPLPAKISKEDDFLLQAKMYALAFEGSRESLEYLRKLTSSEYWKKRNVQNTSDVLQMNSDALVEHYRSSALQAIADSGTELAVSWLKSGDGLPQEDAKAFPLLAKSCEQRLNGTYWKEQRYSPFSETKAATKKRGISPSSSASK